MAVQMWSRAHRRFPDLLSYGKVLILNDFENFRRQKTRVIVLQSSWQDTDTQATGKRLEKSLHHLYALISHPSHCLQQQIEISLGGVGEPQACTTTSLAKGCCNCRAKWFWEEKKRNLIAEHAAASSNSKKKKIATALTKIHVCSTAATWSRSLLLLGGALSLRVLDKNDFVSSKLASIIKSVLLPKRFGLPLAQLVNAVSVRTHLSKKKGENKSAVRWCLTYLIIQNFIEEVTDSSPLPPDTERTSTYKPKQHVILTNEGTLALAAEWPVIPINEKLGQYL